MKSSIDTSSYDQNKLRIMSCTAKDFYLIEHATDEDILHEYHKCNNCGVEPIWGNRFKCATCEDVDLCEQCFDLRLLKLNIK